MMKCVFCGSNSNITIANKVRDSSKNKIIQCKKCNQIQLYPIPLRGEDQIFYDNNLQEKNQNQFSSLQEHKKKSVVDTKRRIDFVSKICKKKDRILEIGSGYGFFLEGMKKN